MRKDSIDALRCCLRVLHREKEMYEKMFEVGDRPVAVELVVQECTHAIQWCEERVLEMQPEVQVEQPNT